MAYRGYFELGDEELANTSRVIDHIRELSSADDAALQDQLPGGCRPFEVEYDDTWSQFKASAGQEAPYSIEYAPWVTDNLTDPIARQFMGVWVLDVQGLDASTYTNPVTESLGHGGTAGYGRRASRTVNFTALVIGTTDAGAQFGMRWLERVLLYQSSTMMEEGMRFLPFTPEDSGIAPEDVKYAYAFRPAVTRMPEVVELAGLGGGRQHQQSTIRRVEFSITFLDPNIYAEPTMTILSFTETTTPVQWVKTADCFDSSTCRAHVIYPPTCAGNLPEIIDASPVTPQCAGCMKVCDVSTRVATIGLPDASFNDSVIIGFGFMNAGAADQSATFYLREVDPVAPPRPYDPRCDYVGSGAINAVGPGLSVVALPKYRGVRITDDADIRPTPAVGFLTAPTGAPYRLPAVRWPTSTGSWEMVLETNVGDEWFIAAYTYRRLV